jgi:hypothetical protein
VLGCPPAELKPASDKVTVAEYYWGTLRTATWVLERPGESPSRVDVDVDRLFVTLASWGGPTVEEAKDSAPEPKPEDLLRTAESDIRRVSPLFRPDDKLKVNKAYPYRAEHAFGWVGSGPEGGVHEVVLVYDLRNGRLKRYTATVRPKEPEPVAEWKLSEEAALERVSAYLKREKPRLEVHRLTLVRRTTQSMFAPPGRPVYEVEWEGFLRIDPTRPRGRQSGWGERDVCAVDAQTGAILTRPPAGGFTIRSEPRPK